MLCECVNVKPQRTVPLCLWNEERGLLPGGGTKGEAGGKANTQRKQRQQISPLIIMSVHALQSKQRPPLPFAIHATHHTGKP